MGNGVPNAVAKHVEDSVVNTLSVRALPRDNALRAESVVFFQAKSFACNKRTNSLGTRNTDSTLSECREASTKRTNSSGSMLKKNLDLGNETLIQNVAGHSFVNFTYAAC